MKKIYHTEFRRQGYGQWIIYIEFEDSELLKIFTTDSQLYDEWYQLEGEEKNKLIAERLDYKIDEYFSNKL